VVALALAVLTHAGWITYPLLLVLVFLLGTANAFEIPTRQSFFVDLVGKDDLGNAIALNSAAFSGTRIVGPAIAGVLIGTVGIAASFYVNALSYVGVLIALLMMRLPRFRPPERTTGTLENLREGFAFIRSDRRVRTVVWLVAAMSVSVFPFVMLLPIFARDILEVGPTGLGWLMAASGAGALAGGMALAAWGSRMPRGRLILVSCSAFALFVAAFAVSRSFPCPCCCWRARGSR
jgi:MFS family permease